MAEQLTPRTPDLEVRGPSLARGVISLDEELNNNKQQQILLKIGK